MKGFVVFLAVLAAGVGLIVVYKQQSGGDDSTNDTTDTSADDSPLDSVVNAVSDAVNNVTSSVSDAVDSITGSSSSPYSAAVQKIATAIAAAEGYNVPGSVPNRNNNPGDLRVDVNGKGTGKDQYGFIVYGSASDGWDALFQQVQKMLNNTSHVYNSGMTIAQVAAKYTTTAQGPWASIVASSLGVSTDTPLDQIA